MLGEEHFLSSLWEKTSGFRGLYISIKSTGSVVTKIATLKTSAGERRWLLVVAMERNWRDKGAQDNNGDPHESDQHDPELSCCQPGQIVCGKHNFHRLSVQLFFKGFLPFISHSPASCFFQQFWEFCCEKDLICSFNTN